MKNKICKVMVVIIAIIFSSTFFIGCNQSESYLSQLGYCEESAIDSGVTIEKLMDTRDLIRESNIYIETHLYQTGPGGQMSFSKSRALGSGVIFAEDEECYYALSNWHVIEYEGYLTAQYELTTITGKLYTSDCVEIIKQSKENDLAIIKFSKLEDLKLIDIETRKGTNLIKDELLFAVGNPSGVQNNVTFGTYVGMAKIGNVDYEVIHHNALINAGNSGGALCDVDGNLVGINTWGSENSDTENFAIPLNIIHEFIII